MRSDRRMTRKKKRAALFMLCAGLIGVVCFSIGIAVYLYGNWQDASYYESLAGSFAAEETQDP